MRKLASIVATARAVSFSMICLVPRSIPNVDLDLEKAAPMLNARACDIEKAKINSAYYQVVSEWTKLSGGNLLTVVTDREGL